MHDRENPRPQHIYRAFKFGARLTTDDVVRLLASRGIDVSRNRLREFGRDSDRGGVMTMRELYELVSAWADEQRPPETQKAPPPVRAAGQGREETPKEGLPRRPWQR